MYTTLKLLIKKQKLIRIISDKYTIELTYNELLLIYESVLKMAEEAIMNNKEWSAEQDMQLFEISFMLGKGDEYRRTIERFFNNKSKQE